MICGSCKRLRPPQIRWEPEANGGVLEWQAQNTGHPAGACIAKERLMKSLRTRRTARTSTPAAIVLGTAATLTLGQGSGSAESKRYVYNSPTTV